MNTKQNPLQHTQRKHPLSISRGPRPSVPASQQVKSKSFEVIWLWVKTLYPW